MNAATYKLVGIYHYCFSTDEVCWQTELQKNFSDFHLVTLFVPPINTKVWPINEYYGKLGSGFKDGHQGLPHFYWVVEKEKRKPLMAGHHQQPLSLPFLLETLSLQTLRHPHHRWHHRRLFPENLSRRRLFFKNQLTLDLASLLYNKCIGGFLKQQVPSSLILLIFCFFTFSSLIR